MFAMGVTHICLQFSVMVRIYAITASQRAYVVFYGAAAAIMAWVLANALFKCFTHHIVWRGTNYRKLQEVEPVILPIAAAERVHTERVHPERRLKKSA
jgi:hypothetical protein